MKVIVVSIAILILLMILVSNCKESWCNTYSGWPGPIENGNGNYNIPALYGRGQQYENKNLHFTYGLNKNSAYLPMRGYPCGDREVC
jgi:hypothetical protein